MKRILILLATAALMAGCGAPSGKDYSPAGEPFSLSSPDGELTATFYLTESGTPVYTLSRGDVAVMDPGVLGFELRGTVKYQGLE